jgi:putative ABC transport system permease protein
MRDFAAHVRRHLPARGLPPDRYDEIVDELASELEARYSALLARGASDADAWHETLAQIPSWPQLAGELSASAPKQRRRSRWPQFVRPGTLSPDRWRRDVQYGLRVLWRDRGFAITAIATLAVCLGGHAVIAAGVNAVLFHPLRVPEPERVLLMANQYPRVEARINTVSATPDYEDRLNAITVLEDHAFYNYSAATVDVGGVPTRIAGIVATPSLFRLLRVQPAHGRIFTDSEGTTGNDQSVILSDGLWRELYSGDPAAIGRTLRLAGRDMTIVGVLPPDFSFGGPDLKFWIPLALTDRQRSDDARHSNGWFSIGRLKHGATIEQARTQLKALDLVNLERAPAALKPILVNTGFYTSIGPLQDALSRDVRPPLLLVWGASVVVVLIGVVNLANLALVRSRLRLGEIGTRLAIGAGRFYVVRQLLVEALLVSLLGAGIGLLLGAWALSALRTTALTSLQDLSTVRMDLVIVAATVGIGAVIGVMIGLASAIPLFMPLETMLREESRGGTRSRTARASRRTLVVAQMACSFTLLVGAGLLWVSVRNLLSVDPGFRIDHVLTGAINLPPQRYASDDTARAFISRSLDAIRALPSVADAGATTIVPLAGNYQAGVILAEGHVPKPGETVVSVIRTTVTPGYFETIGTPLVRGRYFDERESDPATTSIIIDERLARHFWPGADPIGRRMFRPANPSEMVPNEKTRWLTVVGVVREAQLRGPAIAEVFGGTFYLPYAVTAPRDVGFVIRTKGEPSAVVHDVRAILAGIERDAPLFNVRTLAERMQLSLILRTSTMQLVTIFAGVALLLSALGLYGMLAYLVTQRTREIGVRMAIGSTPREIAALVLREGMTLAMAGMALGAIVFLAIRRVLATQLFGVDASDPRVMIATTLALVAVATAACVYPARRAARVDVVQILSAR